MTTHCYRTPADVVITFPGGDGDLMAERATISLPVKISPGSVAVLAACQHGATASDLAAALTAVGYKLTSQEAAEALEVLAGAGLLCRDDGDGNFPDAEAASRIAADPSWGDRWAPAAFLFHYGTRDPEPLDEAGLAAMRDADLTVPIFKRYPDARQEGLPARPRSRRSPSETRSGTAGLCATSNPGRSLSNNYPSCCISPTPPSTWWKPTRSECCRAEGTPTAGRGANSSCT